MIQVQSLPQALQSLPLVWDDPLMKLVQWAYESSWMERDHWSLTCDPERHAWLFFQPKGVYVPEQGWKLHISADITSAEAILQRILPLLLQEKYSFKCMSSIDNLRKLNLGLLGVSQIGKFLTVYPANDEAAVHLANLLDKRTRGLSGPRIPSDRMLRQDSLVFYRYGGFSRGAHVQDLLGTVWPAIKTPTNDLIADKRGTTYLAPEQRVDPFVQAGIATIATDLPVSPRLLAQRYLILSNIASTVNHTISLALDLECQRTCIIKGQGRLWQGLLPEVNRRCARQEADVLRELHGYQRVPELYDVIEHDDDISLILSDISGQSLMERVSKTYVYHLLPFQQIIAWGRDLADILEVLHEKGLVFADLKPTNVLIGSDEKLYLIDFELTARQSTPVKEQLGTRGYISSQQFAGHPRSFADDVYSFGALLYLLVTGAEPSQAPDQFALLKRPIESLRPDVPSALAAIIKKCLEKHPETRYTSMHEVITDLDALANTTYDLPLANSEIFHPTSTAEASHAGGIAKSILNTLCQKARQLRESDDLPWKTTHPLANDYALRDVNSGLAGTILAFAGLVAELAEPQALDVLAQSVKWLQALPPHSDPPLPGLYIGEAGVGTALLCAGQVLGDQATIEAALACGRLVAKLPHLSPDIMHGTAGRLLFHLLLWDETGAQDQLAAAVACGEYLLETAQARESGEVCWVIPAELQAFSADAYTGYAHGTAGIADALLDLFEATGDERLIPAIQGTAQWLKRLAIPVLPDQSGLSWPTTEAKSTPALPFWCHGATGVGRFFLHASRHAWVPDAMHIAERAAQAVIHLGKFGGPTLCHGLAGNGEFLLDMYQETKQLRYLVEAQTFGHLLEAFAAEKDGLVVFHGDHNDVFSPDYLIGYAGIALTFLRLSAPERIPYQLSRTGLQAYKRYAHREQYPL